MPNVLFITADQFRGDCLSAAGHPVVRTPNLDRLAAGGVSFRRHFANAAPCGPSRAVLYTGMYLCNHRAVINGSPLDDRFTNFAREARALGYEPALFGYTDIGIDPRTVAADDPRLFTLRGRAPRLRPGVQPARGRSAGVARLVAEGGLRPPRQLARVRRPTGRRDQVAHAVRRRAHADRVPHRPRARLRRRPRRRARGSCTCRTCARTRRSSRPRPTTRCTTPRRPRSRCARRRAPRKARSTRCSA